MDEVEHTVKRRTDIHYPKPQVLSITQSTELGTLYTPEELIEIHGLTKRLNLKLHMDGARFANAVAALQVHPKELTWRAGVDVLTFGGTKCGMPMGEAVVFFNKNLAEGVCLSMQAGRTTGVEDALPFRTLARPAQG